MTPTHTMPRVLVAAAAAAGFAAAGAVKAPAPSQVLGDMQLASDYFFGTVAKGLGDCGWERGAFYAGNAAHYSVSKNETLRTIATSWAQSWGWACKNSTNANDQVCGEQYRQLYVQDPSPDKLALDVILGKMVANASMVEDWTWVDAIFMALPTFLGYGVALNNPAYLDKAMNEYVYSAYYIPSAKKNVTRTGLWSAQHCESRVRGPCGPTRRILHAARSPDW